VGMQSAISHSNLSKQHFHNKAFSDLAWQPFSVRVVGLAEHSKGIWLSRNVTTTASPLHSPPVFPQNTLPLIPLNTVFSYQQISPLSLKFRIRFLRSSKPTIRNQPCTIAIYFIIRLIPTTKKGACSHIPGIKTRTQR
jgi:hypothetical protein